MRIEPQNSSELNDLARRLHSHRVAMLTLVEASSGLSSRPMTPLEMDGSGAIWIMASREAMRGRLGKGAQPVNLAFMGHGESDYVSIAGVAELVDDAERKQQLWSGMGRPWFDGPKDPDLVLLKVTPQTIELWDGPDSVVTRTLALAASVVAGRSVGLGHKDMIDTARQRQAVHG